MKLNRIGVAVATLALALTAGCGSSGGSAAAGSDLTKANFASQVMKAQSQAKTAHLDATVNAQGKSMSMAGDMDMTKKDVAFDLALTGGALGGNARFILVDRVIYLKMPGLSQSNKFIKVDASSGSNPVAKMFQQMLSQLNPSNAFQAFNAVTKLKQNGTQEIDGVETTAYTVTVDTQKALKAQGLAGQVPQSRLPKNIVYNVWVDADNQVRRLKMNVQGSTVDMRISKWGEPVDITAPPAGQTTSMRDMMSQLSGSGAAAG